MGRGILLTSYNHPKASKQCASDIISSLNQLLVVRVSMRPWLLIFKHIIEHSFQRKWTLRSVYERKEKNIIKKNNKKYHFHACRSRWLVCWA